MTAYLRHLSLAAFTGAVLFFGAAPIHTLFSGAPMPAGDKTMSQSQCQASCQNHGTPVVEAQNTEDSREADLQPIKPSLLVFVGVGWAILLLSAIRLFSHLHWRPPDIFALNVAYRF